MTTIYKDGEKFEFTCPHCGQHDLQEVMINVVVTSEIKSIGEGGDIDYGTQTNEEGEVQSYECKHCGHEIPGLKESPELYDHLVQQVEKDQNTDERTDEQIVQAKYPDAHLDYDAPDGKIEVLADMPSGRTEAIGSGDSEDEAWANARIYVENE